MRSAIADNGDGWLDASRGRKFRAAFALAGDTLATVPRGYARDHPLREVLKRKDFIATAPLTDRQIIAGDLQRRVAGSFGTAAPFMRFLCRALALQY